MYIILRCWSLAFIFKLTEILEVVVSSHPSNMAVAMHKAQQAFDDLGLRGTFLEI